MCVHCTIYKCRHTREIFWAIDFRCTIYTFYNMYTIQMWFVGCLSGSDQRPARTSHSCLVLKTDESEVVVQWSLDRSLTNPKGKEQQETNENTKRSNTTTATTTMTATRNHSRRTRRGQEEEQKKRQRRRRQRRRSK